MSRLAALGARLADLIASVLGPPPQPQPIPVRVRRRR